MALVLTRKRGERIVFEDVFVRVESIGADGVRLRYLRADDGDRGELWIAFDDGEVQIGPATVRARDLVPGHSVRLTIDAPRNVLILRAELLRPRRMRPIASAGKAASPKTGDPRRRGQIP
jgi:sRNA-binding carbon storage regulator CsrA